MEPLDLSGAARPALRAHGWRPTLDDLFVGVWEGLQRGHEGGCPVCGGALVAHPQAGRGAVSGQCRECGSTLS